jgi:3-hydroxyacyl-CoA dehydrogenase
MFSFDNALDQKSLSDRALKNVQAIAAWKRQDSDMATVLDGGRQIGSVAIIGAGVMGAEIAAAEIKCHLPVTIIDSNPAALATIKDRTAAELAVSTGNPSNRESLDRLLHPTDDLAEAVKCDLIIETIQEMLPAKQKLFRRLEELLTPGIRLASNTSTIPIGKMADGLSSPQRFCGMHFFHPVWQRPLVEIVRGAKTSRDTIATMVAHAKKIHKLPIVVADGPGFLVNRLLLPYLTEALALLMEGASIELVEQSALEFGMAKGPFRLMDEIGLDTTLHAGWSMSAAFPDRIATSPLLVAFIKAGRLGQKSKVGFFDYGDPSSAIKTDKPDPAAMEIIARWAKPSIRHAVEDIVVRLMLPMVLEAARILEEGEVRNPRDIDLGAIFGLGFPAWRGGLLWWADAIGAARMVDMLRPLESIGSRLQPTAYLLDLASKKGKFYKPSVMPLGAGLPIEMEIIPDSTQFIE